MGNQTTYGCKIRLFIAKTDTLKTLDDLKQKMEDMQKVLSFVMRVKNFRDLQLVLVATSSDMRENIVMSSVDHPEADLELMRQLSNPLNNGNDSSSSELDDAQDASVKLRVKKVEQRNRNRKNRMTV